MAIVTLPFLRWKEHVKGFFFFHIQGYYGFKKHNVGSELFECVYLKIPQLSFHKQCARVFNVLM